MLLKQIEIGSRMSKKKELHPQTLLFLVKVQQMSESLNEGFIAHILTADNIKNIISTRHARTPRGVDVLAPPL